LVGNEKKKKTKQEASPYHDPQARERKTPSGTILLIPFPDPTSTPVKETEENKTRDNWESWLTLMSPSFIIDKEASSVACRGKIA